MKRFTLIYALALGLIVALAGTGCKHGPKGLTPIPGQKAAPTGPGASGFNTPPSGPTIPAGPSTVNESPLATTASGTELGNRDLYEGRPVDREIFKAYTVYFDFDRSTIKASEKPKLEAVADQMKKATADKDLLIDGHCDERGTEEYNRALGERRALALREYLVNLGISASRIQTKSWGKDKPVDPEHNEAAWAKNRRGEFGMLLPKP
jgi:peptidoglycan-associated lipoprotein